MKDSIIVPLITAAVLWFVMFSPWTSGSLNFWVMMSCSAVVLTTMALTLGKGWRGLLHDTCWWQQLLLGIGLAALLWGMFWVGDKVSSLLFGFARPQVDSIYGMKEGTTPWLIAVLLVAVIGPAEELFWRGYIQRHLSQRYSPLRGFVVTTVIYTLIHLWSFNFMLIMAALVAGVVWGGLYWLKPKWLPALVISHALWDACVFVVFPI